MPNALQIAGSAGSKQSRYAPILIHKFFKGLWTQRNPFTDAGTAFLIEKFYSGTSFDGLIDGLNVELTNRLTLKRRPGCSVYNSQTFAPIQRFYEFRPVNPDTNIEQIIVIADTAAMVYNATGPSTKLGLYSKLATAGQTSFQSVGNTLYASDGAKNWKWLWFPNWVAAKSYPAGEFILDSTSHIQQALGAGAGVVSTAVSSNVLTVILASGTYPWLAIGASVTFYGMVNQPWLNGLTLTITNVSGLTITLSVSHANYTTSGDTTGAAINGGATVSGGISPTFSPAIGAVTGDASGTLWWLCKGPSVQDWGIIAPTTAPNAVNQLAPLQNSWAANTYFWTGDPLILDSNGNIQLQTTPGTTAGSVPTWATSVGATTTDGGAVWTCQGTGTRSAGATYALGAYIAVSWTTTVITYSVNSDDLVVTTTRTTNNLAFFKCTQAGTASSTATSALPWSSGNGSKVTDGGVVWTCQGYEVTRTTSATSSPSVSTSVVYGAGGTKITYTTTVTAGNVGNTQAVQNVNQISDSNGNLESVQYDGKTGGTAPTWPTMVGNGIVDGGVTWVNQGPFSAPGIAPWIYGYAFKNSLSKMASSMSIASSPITLAISSYIALSGSGDPNYATDGVDTIVIYRTFQGALTPFFEIAEIPAPLLGAAWSYGDFSPDPPSPNTTLNQFIQADTTGRNAPPPAGLTGLMFHLGRIFGAVGTTARYSDGPDNPFNGNEAWPAVDNFAMPATVIRQVPLSIGHLILTTIGIYFSGIGGVNLDTPTIPVPFLEGKVSGLLGYNALDVAGTTLYLVSSNRKALQIDISTGMGEIGFPIGDVLALGNSLFGTGISPTGCYVAWHEQDSTDSALYLATPGAAAAAWHYRLNPTPAPETGMVWSPMGVNQKGFSAVQSIETSPGTRQLLLGPPLGGTGTILCRDTTTNADNGTAYSAYADIGSVVLVHPGQVALVDFIATDCEAVGSRPTVKVLLGEIGGHASMVTYGGTLSLGVPDPPELGPASAHTLYNDRWWMSASQAPALCRHLQIEIAWPAENQPNELLSYAIFGAHYQEL